MFFQRTTGERGSLGPIPYLFVLLVFSGTTLQAPNTTPDIDIFVRAGCPHCEAAKIFLDELRREQPSLHIALHDIAEDPAARQRLITLVQERGITTVGVPTFLVGTELIIGFQSSETTGAEIRAKLDRKAPGVALPPMV